MLLLAPLVKNIYAKDLMLDYIGTLHEEVFNMYMRYIL